MNVQALPIGVFDSGLGGLSVLRSLRAMLPAEDVLYYADSAHCPYGLRTPEEILHRSATITSTLVQRGAKLIIVACNTATSVALQELRGRFGLPIVGLVPAVKPAVAATRSGRIGVLATPRTACGETLAELIRRHADGAEVFTVAAPGLADLVEAGYTVGPEVEVALQPLLDPLVTSGVDTLVLGCTHYPFLRDAIRDLVGPDITVIDSGEAIARRTRDVLATCDGLRPGSRPGNLELLTSGGPKTVGAVASRLLGEPVVASHLLV
ncbi:MAG: glutamate racemase [Chloroflexota bacterium]|nr:glutamate racemase [Chloroflexota bacterium]